MRMKPKKNFDLDAMRRGDNQELFTFAAPKTPRLPAKICVSDPGHEEVPNTCLYLRLHRVRH